MHKFLKYLGTIIVFVILLLIVAPLFIPLDKYKGIATEKVKEATGRKLEIGGNISLSLLPFPEIKIQDIKLSSVEGAHYHSLFEAKDIKVSISYLSLLTGNISVSKIKINEPIVNLERLKNGSVSWDFSKNTSSPEKSANQASENKEKSSPSFEIASLEILGAKINYFEANNSGSHTSNIAIDNLEIKNFHGLDDLACEFYSTGKSYTINGSIHEDKGVLSLKTNIDLFKEKINLSGDFDRKNLSFTGKLTLEGDEKSLKSIMPDFNIDGKLNHQVTFDIIADKKLVKISDIDTKFGDLSAKGNATYDITKNQAGLTLSLNPGNVEIILTPSTISGKELSEQISVKANSLKEIINALKLKNFSVDIFNKSFSFLANLAYSEQNISLNDIVLNIDKTNLTGKIGIKDWNKNLTVHYDLKTISLSNLLKLLNSNLPANIDDIQIKGESSKAKENYKTNTTVIIAKTTNTLKGEFTVNQPIKTSLTFTSSGNNLGQSLGILLNSTPNTMIGNYSLSAKIDGDLQKTIKIYLDKSTFSLNNNPLNLTGSVDLELFNSTPKILATIKIPSLNLTTNPNDVASSSTRGKNNSSGTNQSQQHWSNDKIDLSFFNKIDANINLDIQKIVNGGLVFDGIKTVLLLDNGVLNLKSLSGNLYGGKVEASGQLSSQNNQSAVLRASLKGADLRNISPQGSKIKVTQGKVNFDADLKTNGQSQYQYISNLFGNAKLTASEGKISGFDLQRVVNSLRKVQNLDSILKALDLSFAGGETAFKQLYINTDIKKGIANLTEFKLDIPSVDISATGNVNLPKYTLDLNSVVNVDIKSMPALKVYIYGYLDNPQHKLDTQALQQHLIKNVLNNVISDIKKGTKPEELLKGIIGGKNNKASSSETQQNSQEPQATQQNNQTKSLESQLTKGLKGLFK